MRAAVRAELLCAALLFVASASFAVGAVQKPGGGPRHSYSSICAVGHNEQPFIREWVKYHLCLGIGVIHLFDHESQPKMETLLTDFIAKGQVTVDWFQGHHHRFHGGFSSKMERFHITAQGYAYSKCLQKYSPLHHFVGFIDIDEFVVINDKKVGDVNALLKDYADYGGVSFHWRTMGSGGHESRPKGSVVDAYTACLPSNHKVQRQIKSFVNTRFHPVMISPHRAEFPAESEWHTADVAARGHTDDAAVSGGPFLVDEAFVPLNPTWNKAKWRRVAIYHYVTKSREDFKVKAERGGGAGVSRTMAYFNKLNSQVNATCRGAIKTRRRFCWHRSLPGG